MLLGQVEKFALVWHRIKISLMSEIFQQRFERAMRAMRAIRCHEGDEGDEGDEADERR